MSISNPSVKNPATKFIEWNGQTGGLRWYNKETEKNEPLELPLRFIVLDQLNTVVGFNESEKSGIYANEVHDLSNEVLSVKFFRGGTLAKGTWENISDKVKANGGKFCKTVYALMKVGDDFDLVAFKFTKSSFGAWLDFSKKVDLTKKVVQVEDSFVKGKKGSVEYKTPVFTALELSDSHLQMAIEADKELQEYFKVYKNQQREKINEETVTTEFKPQTYERATRGGDDVPPVKEEDLNSGEPLPF